MVGAAPPAGADTRPPPGTSARSAPTRWCRLLAHRRRQPERLGGETDQRLRLPARSPTSPFTRVRWPSPRCRSTTSTASGR